MRKIGYNHGSEEIAGCYIFGIDSKSLVVLHNRPKLFLMEVLVKNG